MLFVKSNEWYEEALKVIPMGASTFSRSPNFYTIGGAPLCLRSGLGSRVTDVDGNEFIDYAMALAINTLGYANEEVAAAAKRGIDDGIIFTLSCPEEMELARKIIEVVPCAEMVRFFKNGSDGCEGAVKLARAVTGREKIITVGGYHGFHDWFMASQERNLGVPAALRSLVLPQAYNDIEGIRLTIEQQHMDIAAVIMEPIITVEPTLGFLEEIRRLTTSHGIVLIFDEMKTGFRLAIGGAQEYFKVVPDLAVFAKGLSNGFPLCALTGKRELMKTFENEKCFMSGSYASEKVALNAALKTIEILQRGEVIKHIWEMGEKLKGGIIAIIELHKLEAVMKVVGLAPMQHIVFSDYQGYTATTIKSYLQQECIQRGVLFVGYHHPSFAHSALDIDITLAAYEQAFGLLSAALKANDLRVRIKGQPISPFGVRK